MDLSEIYYLISKIYWYLSGSSIQCQISWKVKISEKSYLELGMEPKFLRRSARNIFNTHDPYGINFAPREKKFNRCIHGTINLLIPYLVCCLFNLLMEIRPERNDHC